MIKIKVNIIYNKLMMMIRIIIMIIRISINTMIKKENKFVYHYLLKKMKYKIFRLRKLQIIKKNKNTIKYVISKII